ncbi:hypothetical protein O181_024169 [Austropuccinia psidii MF-1]|uniref:Reverse transcriptase RNase H-like domain-containing protein n=1 Tax=Austropuccinia psidii MF-1 TaxID=1389203 RepID=A0A9Q3CFS7_9BASI|nr:hypothetical protein [Austropuccinia psidii MF-1]
MPDFNSPQSLLPSRDKVFKEIKHFREDDFVSSLHLFLGNVDLPSSSYHDSLEELWDEEEEPEKIETVMNVFTPAYHHDLDVFSKMKPEKLPPHHACDHHIKLEGSLPQVGVIYASSNQQSDTLREYTNASDYALGAVLSQVSDSGKYPIEFDSPKLLPEELTYEINEKELLGIVWALKCWRGLFLSLSSSFKVLTDHSSLPYFISSNILTCNQACWVEFLSELHFTITYHPVHLETLPDAFSCWDSIYPERGEDFISKNPINYQKIIKQDEIQVSNFFEVKVTSFSKFIKSI